MKIQRIDNILFYLKASYSVFAGYGIAFMPGTAGSCPLAVWHFRCLSGKLMAVGMQRQKRLNLGFLQPEADLVVLTPLTYPRIYSRLLDPKP